MGDGKGRVLETVTGSDIFTEQELFVGESEFDNFNAIFARIFCIEKKEILEPTLINDTQH